MPPVTTFDTTAIEEGSIQLKSESGTGYDPGTPFGCMGTIGAEPDTTEVTKRCGTEIVKTIVKTNFLTVTATAHVPVSVARSIMGLTNEGLKTGVYAAGRKFQGKDFILTATAVDEFEDTRKLIAFPNCSNVTGFKVNVIENGIEEVAMLEFEFRAHKDANGKFYYEAFEDEVVDEAVKTSWHTAFTPELVALDTP